MAPAPSSGDAPRPERVTREVRSADPSLSAEANARLTDELREAVGADAVEVAADAGDPAVRRHGTRARPVTLLAAHRVAVVMVGGALLVMGAVASLATGSWWLLLVAVGVHAVGTVVAVGVALQLSTEVEHVAPSTAARLEEEGVADPDAAFSELVEDFAGADGERGLADVASPGGDERTRRAHEDPAEASAQQRSAMTPSSEESAPTDGTG